jgi:cysteinyl-tRNA synthetase
MKFFGPQIDIHMGGCDLIFPHHQNEIAQTEAYTGKTFATYWLHGGHLLVDNKKMSKSAKNFYTLQDIVAYMVKNAPTVPTQVVYRAFRLMALQNSYRENFNFTWERLTAAVHTIVGLDDMLRRLARYMHTTESTYTQSTRNAHGKLKHPSISREFRDNIQYFTQTFIEKLEADFALPEAMSIVFELQTYIHTGIDGDIFTYEELKSIVSLLQSWDSVIYILDFGPLDPAHSVPADVQILLDERALAKSTRDYVRADEIRDILLGQGYRIIDDKNGAYVEKV